MEDFIILTRNVGKSGSRKIDTYLASGGYEAARKALEQMTPQQVIDEVKASELRGRGGAGFPTGVKWGFLPKNDEPRYFCCNCDESEPGSFKDRLIVMHDPHLLLEGILIGSYATMSHHAFIYIRGEFVQEARILEQAISEAYAKGFLGKKILGTDYHLDLAVYTGAGAYICGEETAMLESMEGKRGWPRTKPPFPATHGLLGKPTVVNNVETCACFPAILTRGAKWFAAIGKPRNTGPKLFGLSGHVNRPGQYELPLGIPLRELIEKHGGGVLGGRKLKAVIPGGSSAPPLTAEEAMQVDMDFDSLAGIGSMLGTGGVIVMDETVSMVSACLNVMRFYAHESCGQCTPCRVGCPWATKIVDRIYRRQGKPGDIQLLLDICDQVQGKTICPFGEAFALPLRGYVTKFRSEFDEAIRESVVASAGARDAGAVLEKTV